MPKPDYPHVLPCEWDDIVFDRNSIGATSRSDGGSAIWVAMRPSIFLEIATPLPRPRASLEWLKSQIKLGRSIAPAELTIDPRLGVPLALSHEGRHRMTAIRHLLSDRSAPVRILLAGCRDWDIDPKLIEKVRSGARSQRGRSFVAGPLFENAEIDLGGIPPSGVPPPDCRMRPKAVKLTHHHLGKIMTKLGEFLGRIKQDARAGALLVAAGVLTVLSSPDVADAGARWNAEAQPRVVVEEVADAHDLFERISDQLGGMKPLSDALAYSVSFGSPNISGIQKARNLAIAFDFQLQQAAHGEHAEVDRYLVATPEGGAVSQELRDLVELVNAKKMELYEFTLLLSDIEKALAAGDTENVEELTATLSRMADQVQFNLYNDISVGYEDRTDSEASRMEN